MKKWFVVRVQTGREHIIKKLIEEEISAHGLDEYVDEVFIPTKKVAKMSKKGKVTVDKRLYPGYIWIKMEDKEELMKVISGVRGVLYFAGKGRGPQPVKDEEMAVVLSLSGKEKEGAPVAEVPFKEGDSVRIIDGPFADFCGEIEAVYRDRQRLRVVITVFGRKTPVEVNFWQVEPVY